MKELIDEHQAHLLMLAVLALAPLFGLVWGWLMNRLVHGLSIGFLVGGGNFALWTVYNAITNHLGLDTVKNLLINLGLFVFLGIIAGIGAGYLSSRKGDRQAAQGGEHGDVAGYRRG